MRNSRITYLSVVLLVFSWQLSEGADVVCTHDWDGFCVITAVPKLADGEPLNIISSNPQGVDYLELTNVTKLHRTFFDTFPNLKTVNVHNAQIDRINRGDLQNASHVRDLDLNRNEIEDIEDFSFTGLDTARKLTLSGNKLRVVRRNTFVGLVNLIHLVLSFNQIELIEDGAFNFPHLQTLSLEWNNLTTISRTILVTTPPLTDLFIANNGLTKIGEFLVGMTALEKIDLGGNAIADLNFTTFAKMPKLEVLIIAQSPIETASEEDVATAESAGSQLKQIWLSGDQLSHRSLSAIHRIFKNLQLLFICCEIEGNSFPNAEIQKALPGVEIVSQMN